VIIARSFNLIPIIAGIDPGTTTGIALLDLEGNLILTAKKKNLPRSKIIKFISDVGTPVVIAGDVSPASRLIEKIASTFSARVIIPDDSLRRKDKIATTRDFLNGSNKRLSRHERDALAAAIYGWKRLKPLIIRVDEKLKSFPGSIRNDVSSFVKTNVILNGGNIASSIKQFKELNINQ